MTVCKLSARRRIRRNPSNNKFCNSLLREHHEDRRKVDQTPKRLIEKEKFTNPFSESRPVVEVAERIGERPEKAFGSILVHHPRKRGDGQFL